MAYAARLPRYKRAALLSSVAALHVAVLLFIMMNSGGPVIAKAAVRGLSLISVRNPPPPPPVPLRVIVKPFIKLAVAPLLLPTSPVKTLSDTKDCSVEEVVAKAIMADPASLEAVDRAPAETRSLSDAMVIWNAGWTDTTHAPTGPLVAIRQIVLETLASVDEQCLDVPVVGPRLIGVPSGDQTRLLVFGSGTWTWRQLVADNETQPLPDSPATDQAQPASPPGARNELFENALK